MTNDFTRNTRMERMNAESPFCYFVEEFRLATEAAPSGSGQKIPARAAIQPLKNLLLTSHRFGKNRDEIVFCKYFEPRVPPVPEVAGPMIRSTSWT